MRRNYGLLLIPRYTSHLSWELFSRSILIITNTAPVITVKLDFSVHKVDSCFSCNLALVIYCFVLFLSLLGHRLWEKSTARSQRYWLESWKVGFIDLQRKKDFSMPDWSQREIGGGAGGGGTGSFLYYYRLPVTRYFVIVCCTLRFVYCVRNNATAFCGTFPLLFRQLP
jgi:hypothetical protein